MIEQTHSSDDNLLAAASHFFGFWIALLIWLLHKGRPGFVRFQAAQAVVFDIILVGVAIIVAGTIMALALGILAFSVGDIALFGSQNNPTAGPARSLVALLGALPFLVPCIIVPIVLSMFVIRMVATIQTIQGKDFRYPWVGNLVQSYYQPGVSLP